MSNWLFLAAGLSTNGITLLGMLVSDHGDFAHLDSHDGFMIFSKKAMMITFYSTFFDRIFF